MRLIRLGKGSHEEKSKYKFETMDEVTKYFENDLWSRDPEGRFQFGNEIARNKFEIGEELLFTYKAMVRYIAKSASIIKENKDNESHIHPSYFVIDMKTLKRVNDIPNKKIMDLVKSIKWTKYHNRIWVRIEDAEEIERVWEKCVESIRSDFPGC